MMGRKLGHLRLLGFFLGAALLEILVGRLLLGPLEDQRRQQLLEQVQREHQHLVRALEVLDARGGAQTDDYQSLVAAFKPLPGSASALLDAAGKVVAGDPGLSVPSENVGTLLHLPGVQQSSTGYIFSQALGALPELWLETRVPAASLEAQLQAQLREPWRGLVLLVGLANLVGFLGVLFHRLRIAPQRWRETESYLKVIRGESSKYRALMEKAADMLLLLDPVSGAIREANAEARRNLGFELPAPAEPVGSLSGVRAVAHPPVSRILVQSLASEDVQRFEEALALARRGMQNYVAVADLRIFKQDGSELSVDVRLARIDIDAESGQSAVLVSLRDLSQQKELERQLAIHERLSSLGLITAGVAHEINNPLEGIGNYLSLLEREGVEPDKRKHYLELVRHGIGRIRDIVRELLAFARPQPQAGTADLAQVVERALSLAELSSRFHQVEVVRRGLDHPLVVSGDAGRLEQVVFNLLINAANAMEGRGRIELCARVVSSETSSGPLLELLIADTGPGIAASVIDRIFDPFFTTGQGSGLGLSVSYGIMRAHGGALSVHNRAEGGAEFCILLPWAPSPATHPGGSGVLPTHNP